MSVDLLRSIPLFDSLNHEELTGLAELLKRQVYSKHDTIFWMHEKGDHLYIVENGIVRISYTDKEGQVDKETRTLAENALTRLLPRLQSTDKTILNPDQIACLNRALGRDNRPLVIAILSAYEQIGDETCVRPVEDLIAGSSKASVYETVIEAARHCLAALKQNIELQRQSRTLVRAAMGPTEEMLLRPVEGNDKTDPEILLRPTAHHD